MLGDSSLGDLAFIFKNSYIYPEGRSSLHVVFVTTFISLLVRCGDTPETQEVEHSTLFCGLSILANANIDVDLNIIQIVVGYATHSHRHTQRTRGLSTELRYRTFSSIIHD